MGKPRKESSAFKRLKEFIQKLNENGSGYAYAGPLTYTKKRPRSNFGRMYKGHDYSFDVPGTSPYTKFNAGDQRLLEDLSRIKESTLKKQKVANLFAQGFFAYKKALAQVGAIRYESHLNDRRMLDAYEVGSATPYGTNIHGEAYESGVYGDSTALVPFQIPLPESKYDDWDMGGYELFLKSKGNIMPTKKRGYVKRKRVGKYKRVKRTRKTFKKKGKRKSKESFRSKVLRAMRDIQPPYVLCREGSGNIKCSSGLDALWQPLATIFGSQANDTLLAAKINVAAAYPNFKYYMSGSLDMIFTNVTDARAILEIYTFKAKVQRGRVVDPTVGDPLTQLTAMFTADNGPTIVDNFDIATSLTDSTNAITTWTGSGLSGGQWITSLDVNFGHYKLWSTQWIVKKKAVFNLNGGDNARYQFKWSGHTYRPETDYSVTHTYQMAAFPIFHLFKVSTFPGLGSTGGVAAVDNVSTTNANIAVTYKRTDRVKPMYTNNRDGVPTQVLDYNNARPNYAEMVIPSDKQKDIASFGP